MLEERIIAVHYDPNRDAKIILTGRAPVGRYLTCLLACILVVFPSMAQVAPLRESLCPRSRRASRHLSRAASVLRAG